MRVSGGILPTWTNSNTPLLIRPSSSFCLELVKSGCGFSLASVIVISARYLAGSRVVRVGR